MAVHRKYHPHGHGGTCSCEKTPYAGRGGAGMAVLGRGPVANANPLRVDPTRTKTLRDAWVREMNRRFKWLAQQIRHAVIDLDVFGLVERQPVVQEFIPPPVTPLQPGAFRFSTDAAKVEGFMDWVGDLADKGILEVTSREGRRVVSHGAWANVYIQSAYKKGITRAWQELENLNIPTPGGGDRALDAVFNSPVHAERVGVIYTRTFQDLKGITAAMDQQLSRTLAQGLAEGRNPRELARTLVKDVENINIKRARVLARTETIRAHHTANIATYEEAGLEQVVVMAEWATAGFNVCPDCADLNGRVFKLKEIADLIPLHPNCRCMALPAAVGEKTRGVYDPSTIGAEYVKADGTVPRRQLFEKKVGDAFPKPPRKLPALPKLKISPPPQAPVSRRRRPAEPKPPPVEPPPPPEIPKVAELPEGMEGAAAFGQRLQLLPEESVGGSTGAQVFVDDEGAQWIVKKYSGNKVQAQNEWVANRLYREAKVNVPQARLAEFDDGSLGVALKRIDEKGLVQMGEQHVDFVAGTKRAQSGFLVDAWLANWDVAGTGWDNILLVPGSKTKIWRVDQGGSLLFRAQGELKGAAFGSEVLELQSLRDATNTYAQRLFAQVTDDDIRKQFGSLLNRMNRTKLREVIRHSGMPIERQEELFSILDARLKYLRRWRTEYNKRQKTRGVLGGKVAEHVDDPLAPITAQEAERIAASRANGYAVRWDGPDIEDQQILVWVETNEAGKQVTRATFKVTERARDKYMVKLKRGVDPDAASSPVAAVRVAEEELDTSIITALKGISTRAATGLEQKDFDRIREVMAKHTALNGKVRETYKGVQLKAAQQEAANHWEAWILELSEVLVQGKVGEALPDDLIGNIWLGSGKMYERGKGLLPMPKVAAAKEPTSRYGLFAGEKWKWRASNSSNGNIVRSGDIDWGPAAAPAWKGDFDGVHVQYVDVTDNIRQRIRQSGHATGASDKVEFVAMNNLVSMEVEGTGAKATQQLFDAVGKMGLEAKRATALDLEELYLRQLAQRKASNPSNWENLLATWDPDVMPDQADRIKALRKHVSSKSGVSDVSKLPGYEDAVRGFRDQFGNGWARPRDVTLLNDPGWAEFVRNNVVHAHVTGGDIEGVISDVLNTGGNFAGTAHRLRKGVKRSGMSSGDDMATGGADGVFTRIHPWGNVGSNSIVWKPRVAARMNSVHYPGDSYGLQWDQHFIIKRRSDKSLDDIKSTLRNDGNELVLKGEIPILEDMVGIVVPDSGTAERMRQIFRQHGYSKVDGKALDDFVMTKSDYLRKGASGQLDMGT